jgi:hypothetical protein
VLLIL